eukprot:s1541_g3.t1
MNFLTTGWNDFGGLLPDFLMVESIPRSYVRDESFLEFPEEWAEDLNDEEGEVEEAVVKEEEEGEEVKEEDEEMNQDEDRMESAEHADDTEEKELKG